jgi:peroxiredoxin
MYATQEQILAAGQPAPDFELSGVPTGARLSDFQGRPVVLVFYPADFSPVCTDQLSLYQTATPAFDRYDAQLLAISTDGLWCHRAFAQQRGLQFPMLSDAWPHGLVAEAYGVLDTDDGRAGRALFVLDPQGVVTWSYVSPAQINPGADGILAALDAMTGAVTS